MPTDRATFRTESKYQPILRELGLDAEAVFDHPDIKPWRTLSDRENCLLDTTLQSGTPVRWHIKRYPAGTGDPARLEAQGLQLLEKNGIPTAPLVAHGGLPDGRSFLILDDLAGYAPADKLLEQSRDKGQDVKGQGEVGTPIPPAPLSSPLPPRPLSLVPLLNAVTDLASDLHNANLHHRDLYLCHFLVRPSDLDVRLIDAARVKPLPPFPLKMRWVVKDLAQLWYSTLAHPQITDAHRQQILDRYTARTTFPTCQLFRLRQAVEGKSNRIAKHDRNLNARQPNRNISIPTPPAK